MNNAVSDSAVTNIKLAGNITDNVSATRLVNIDLGGHTLTGNVSMDSNSTGTVAFSNGTIAGNLTVNTPNATVNNSATVTGTTTITDPVAFTNSGTLTGTVDITDPNSMSFSNTGTLSGGVTIDPSGTLGTITLGGTIPSVTISGTNGANVTVANGATVSSITVTSGASGTMTVTNEGTVTTLTNNSSSPVTVSGAAIPQKPSATNSRVSVSQVGTSNQFLVMVVLKDSSGASIAGTGQTVNVSDGSTTQLAVWNGSDNAYEYTFTENPGSIKFTTAANGVGLSSETITIPVAPTITNTPNGYINASSSPGFYPVSGNGTYGDKVYLTVSDGTHQATGAGTVLSDGLYTANVDLTLLNQGTLTFTATQSGPATETSPASGSVQETLDTVAPSAPTIATSAESVNTGSITITGTAESGSEVTISGGSSTETGVATSGNYSISVPLIANAVNNLSVTATDVAGNTSNAATVAITEDNTAPTDENTVLTASQTVKDGASVTLNAAPATGETVWLAPAGTPAFTAGSTMTKSTTSTITAPATDGTYYVYIVDTAGNVSAASTDSVIADSTAPSTPGTQAVVPDSTTGLDVSWTASTDSGSGVVGYNVYYSTSATGTWTKDNRTPISSSSTSYRITDDTGSPAGPLSSGTTYYVYVSAVDNAGNESAAPTSIASATAK